jgi:FIMAH domain
MSLVRGPSRSRTRDALLVASVVALAAGCRPDTATAPGRVPMRPRAFADVATQGVQLLYEQTSTLDAAVHQNVAPLDFGDDFVVPSGGTWVISRVRLTGLTSYPPVTFAFRNDNGGVPGTVIQSYTLDPVSETLNGCCIALEDFRFDLPSDLSLGAGTHWLTVDASNVGFEWQPTVSAMGSPGLVSKDGGSTWSGFIYPLDNADFAFALFTGHDTPASATGDLQSSLTGLGLDKGTFTSLNAKLSAALAAIGAGDTASACRSLQDFINQLMALSGKKLSTADADALIKEANRIRGLLGC